MITAAKDFGMFEDIIDRCVAARTIRAARVITRQYDQALRGHGITITQFTLLVVIGRHRPSSITLLADGLDIERTTLSRNVAKLREGGFLKENAAEGRSQRLELSEKGMSTLQDVYPKWCSVQDGIEAKLGDPALTTVRASLKALRNIG